MSNDNDNDNQKSSRNDLIEVRSEGVQEVLGNPPSWITQWGITILFFVVVIILIGSFYFKYPEVVNAPIRVTTVNPQAPIMARSSGKIKELFVVNKQRVEAGTYLAIIDNAADRNDVLEVVSNLKLLTSFFDDNYNINLWKIPSNKNYKLGDIQPYYALLIKQYNDYLSYVHLDYYHKKIQSVQEQFNKYATYSKGLEKQINTLYKQFQLAYKQYKRDSLLYDMKNISAADHEKSESQYLQSKYNYEVDVNSLSNLKIQMSQVSQNLLDLNLQNSEEKNKLTSSLKESYDNFNSRIAAWELAYVLKAPINGIVSFSVVWSMNQNVTAGEVVFNVIPDKASQLLGKVKLPIKGSGKVKSGQKVNIKFDNFPYMEYGYVKGIVKTIALVPSESNNPIASDNYFMIDVIFPDSLKTSYGKMLPFSQEMQGTVEIVTMDMSLLERFIAPVKSTLKKSLN